MHRDILVAIDDSEAAPRVLEEAGELARAFRAKLTILSVAPELPAFAYSAGVDVGALEREAAEQARRTVEEAKRSLPDGIEVATAVRRGSPGPEIVRQIEQEGHDLVVIGSRGRRRIAEGVFGSVVADVHFGAHVPMLVVHPAPRG